MAKSQKRKREESITDKEDVSSSKKTKTSNDKPDCKRVKRKENSHNISCSEGDVSDTGSARIQIKEHDNINKTNINSFNTHLLSSESDNEVDLSQDINSEKATSINGEISDSDHESGHKSEEEINHVKNAVKSTSKTSESRNKPRKIPKFTHEFNEEISKFSLLLDENLTDKNDIWILQCPSNMDCSTLVRQRLNFGGSCQLEDGERTYEAYSYRNTCTRSATLAVPSERNSLSLCRVPIAGNIIVEESVKAVENTRPIKLISEPTNRVEFPENLRTRHPLLGVDFSKQPRTAERIIESRSTSKKKKHSKKYGETYNGVTVPDSSFSSIDTPLKKKKKKKDRRSEDETLTNIAEQLAEDTLDVSVTKRKKKKKHKDYDSFN